jgi:hypothetical protein
MNRRKFLHHSAAAVALTALAPRRLFAGDKTPPLSATLTVQESETLATIPEDYVGLSYESAQLANPAFFAAENTALIALFRELSEKGVLRIGGGTSEFTAFTTEETASKPPFDAVGPDTSKNVKSDTPVTPTSLRNLRAFLDAAGWRCLYGLNLGRGKAENAAIEASYVANILGGRLIAFQLGNEPDAWRKRYRPETWSYEDYRKEWFAAHAAVVERVPHAKFAGPDVSNKIAFITGFAEDAKKSAPDVVLLTSHYYRMGPAGAPDITLDKLLSPDAKLARDMNTIMEAARGAGLPYRMCEGNSCWNGGQPGLSDSLASALWAADMMLEFASLGCAGVNLHGGGNGFYTPIAGSLAAGFARRPEYFGIEIAQSFAGATLLRSTLDCSNDRVRAYVARKGGHTLLLVVNKTPQPVTLATPYKTSHHEWLLSGPAIDAKDGIKLEQNPAKLLRDGVLNAPPFSITLVEA